MEGKLEWVIREIDEFDNKELKTVLSSVMIEFGVPKKGTALSDPELKEMSKAYKDYRSTYFVIENDNKILEVQEFLN